MSDQERASKFHVAIDGERCVGSGDCVRIAPAGFELPSQEAVARVLPSVSTVGIDDLARAVMTCPTQAISAVDDSGEEIV